MPLDSIKQLKSYKRVIWNVALISSLGSLDYDGANNFAFCRRKHRRKYNMVSWIGQIIQLNFVVHPLNKALDDDSRDSKEDSSNCSGQIFSEVFPRTYIDEK